MKPMKTMMKQVTAGLLATALAACGGAQKTSTNELNEQARGATPPPEGGTPAKIERAVSNEAQADFGSAVKYFSEQSSWTSATCGAAADKFISVAKSHDKMVEAYFNAGVAYHKCGDTKQAEAMYKKALSVQGSHAPSLANLGEIYFRGGNEQVGEQYFQKAIAADGQIVAARNNLAFILYRRMKNATGDTTTTGNEAIAQLQRVLAVDNDNIVAYTLMALVYMQGADKNKSRLDVAKLLLEEGKKRNASYAPLYNAWGLLHIRKGNVGDALNMFRQAISIDASLTESQMNVAQLVLSFRKYDEAEQQFRQVLTKKELSKEERYNATIGLGVAVRGLKKTDEAARLYEEAKGQIPERGDAYYNLGLLWKDFKTDSTDPKVNKEAFVKAKGYFNQYLSKQGSSEKREEAKDNIESCDKNITALDQAIQIMAQQPPQPAPKPAPPPKP